MKSKNNLFKASGFFLLTVMFVGIVVCGGFAILSLMAGVAGATGLANVAVPGTVTTDKVAAASPDLNKDYVSQQITKMKPASHPLDTIMRSVVKTVDVKSFKTEYYTVDIKPLRDTIRTAYDETAGDGETYGYIEVDGVNNWGVDDTLMIPSVLGSDGKYFAAIVSKIEKSQNRLHIFPLNGLPGSGTTADEEIIPKSIALGATVVRMGTAKSELDAQTDPFAMVPTKDYNYMQNYMAQVEESTFQRIHDQEVDWGFSDYEEGNIYNMRATAELSYLWGFRKKFIDPEDGQEKYTSHGLARYMTKELQYAAGTPINNAKWVDWTKALFMGNGGSESRIIFAADDLIANISKEVSSVQKQIDAKSVEVKWGIKFNKIETNFGMLYIKHHPLLAQIGLAGAGIALDIQNIQKHVFQPLQTTKLELKKSGQRNADAHVLQEVNCPVLRYKETHALITAI